MENKYKKCTKCGEEKPATTEYFHAHKRNLCGLRAVCKICRAKDNADHKEERTAKKREHWHKNKERLNAITRVYYAENAEQLRAYARENYHKNRDRNLKRMRNYLVENRDALNERRRPRSKTRWHELYGSDPVFTLKRRVASLVRRSLRNRSKSKKLEEIFDYSLDELRDHLEKQFTKGMTWDKFFNGEIHIDHIKPIIFFLPKSIDSPEFKECWALSNLQPLWAKENLSKGGKIL